MGTDNKISVFNSFLLAVCLAVMAWVAQKTAVNSEAMAGLQVSIAAMKDSSSKADGANAEAHARLERKLDDTVPRREYDAKMLQLETEQRKSDIRLREIDLEIMKLKQGMK
jgi:parvulin-like peptidyl-prolyl isomerase